MIGGGKPLFGEPLNGSESEWATCVTLWEKEYTTA